MQAVGQDALKYQNVFVPGFVWLGLVASFVRRRLGSPSADNDSTVLEVSPLGKVYVPVIDTAWHPVKESVVPAGMSLPVCFTSHAMIALELI